MNEFRKIKPARNADELLAKLKERGLVVRVEEQIDIKHKINSIGYYRLSGGFLGRGVYKEKADSLICHFTRA
jgi:abortive infection bacteriophage resistance protein